MPTNDIEETVEALLASGKGILAADETVGTSSKRFEALGINSTEERDGSSGRCCPVHPAQLDLLANSSFMTRPLGKWTSQRAIAKDVHQNVTGL